jgi:hypothetical protein
MGLSWVKINRALVLENMVTVQLLATDRDPEGEEISWQGGQPGPWFAPSAGDPAGLGP